jgi:hypothetical protein
MEIGERARRRKEQEKAQGKGVFFLRRQGKGDYYFGEKEHKGKKANVTANMPYFFNHTHTIYTYRYQDFFRGCTY